ncbi:unnamed protein product [Rhizopus stolonifer]
MNSPDKPASPKSVEVQRVVLPEIMQAVTQNTEEYLETAMRKDRMLQNSSAAARAALQQKTVPRSSSRDDYQKSYPQELQQNYPRAANYNHGEPYDTRPTQESPRTQYNTMSNKLQQTPERSNMPSPSQMYKSNEKWNSPPHGGPNNMNQILYSNNECAVFHWNNQSWYAADGRCLLQVRSMNHRTCVSVELQNQGQLYLNAWIMPNTAIRQPSATDVSLSVYMGTKKENYLVHFPQPQDASRLVNILKKAHQESAVCPKEEEEEEEPEDTVHCPQTLKTVVECKAKLFVQTETSKWTTFGGVTIVISQQAPSMRTVIQIENNKTKLVSAVVRSGNVEKISSKRISFLLSDEAQKTSIVYMIHLREEEIGNRIYEQIRHKNAEYGW